MRTLPLHHHQPPRRAARRLRAGLLASVLALGLAAPAVAVADGDAVIADCAEDSRLDKKYTPAEYADALKNIPTDVDEYTDCRDVIRRGQLGLGGRSGSGSGGGTGGGGAGGSAGGGGAGGGAAGGGGDPGGGGNGLLAYDAAIAAATPEERALVAQAVSGSPDGVDIGGRTIRPDALSDGELASLNDLPAPFVIVLALLALGLLAAIVPGTRNRVRTRHQRLP